MVLVLAIGDLHIPHRAADLPAIFKSMLVPGKIQHILCVGNLCINEVYDYLKSLFPTCMYVTQETNLTIGQFKLGLCHGHQIVPWGDLDSLVILQRQLDVDILVTRGGASIVLCTCAVDPSFVLMDIDGLRVVVYVYELIDGEKKTNSYIKMRRKPIAKKSDNKISSNSGALLQSRKQKEKPKQLQSNRISKISKTIESISQGGGISPLRVEIKIFESDSTKN
ncbi:hypothetical protein Cni_G02141 [Canna indica]|uniref:Vacuolar protein sorting-associated protein 29 n=1 Tax=Canna indica TaxID=4628 RepID=A0AAQ3Q1Z6_9LILI|nr:hypothetical protein Cni_G02141 [Canna indica]